MYNVSKHKEKHFNNIGNTNMKQQRAAKVFTLMITELQLRLEHLDLELKARFEG